jgi:hypothetical protein
LDCILGFPSPKHQISPLKGFFAETTFLLSPLSSIQPPFSEACLLEMNACFPLSQASHLLSLRLVFPYLNHSIPSLERSSLLSLLSSIKSPLSEACLLELNACFPLSQASNPLSMMLVS